MSSTSPTSFGVICRYLATAAAASLLIPYGASAQSQRKAPVRDTAVFAGGCFWSMEKAFDHVPGVTSTTSGYSGGRTVRPTYEQVGSGSTGHAESVEVEYDPSKVSYAQLVDAYWHSRDPTDGAGTFCDRGPQYRPIIFVRDSAQRSIAEASKAAVARRFKSPIAVQITNAMPFYAAEEYHQDYYKKNPVQYELYRRGCGRDRSLEKVWGKEAGGK